VGPARTDVSEETVASIFREETVDGLGTLVATSNLTISSEMPVLTRPIRGHTPDDGILHSNSHDILKSKI
jgi:hypothetical protein